MFPGKSPNDNLTHGLWMLRVEITFTARPKIQSQSQIFRYGRSIFCMPYRPNFSGIFDLCFHWVSVVRGLKDRSVSRLELARIHDFKIDNSFDSLIFLYILAKFLGYIYLIKILIFFASNPTKRKTQFWPHRVVACF